MELISLILSSFATLGLGGGSLLLWRVHKRKARAEAAQVETSNAIAAGNEWQEIARARGEQIDRLNKAIDDRWADKNSDRDKIFDLLTENHQQALQIQSLTFRLCNRRGCAEREPQTGY